MMIGTMPPRTWTPSRQTDSLGGVINLPSPHLSAIARSSEAVDEAEADDVVEVAVGAMVRVMVEELTLRVVLRYRIETG